MQVKSIAEYSKEEHSAILSTFIKLQFVKIGLCVYMFEWSLKTGFTVTKNRKLAASNYTHMLYAYLRTRTCRYAHSDTSISFHVNVCLTLSNLLE